MNGRSHLKVGLLSAAIIAVALSGTAVHGQSPKEGGGPEPTVLDLVVGDGWGDWTIDLFISKVEELSDGRLEVRFAGTVPDQEAATQVQSGEADLGQVFARGFESIGAKGFKALLAPFVVNDAETLTAIATGPIGADMLAELSDHGLEGLVIRPHERRFVAGLGRPIVSLADFAGATIEIPRTDTNFAIIRALGAEPVDLGWSDIAQLKTADVDAVVTTMGNIANADWVLTSNLAPSAVPLVWFASAETMAQLSPEDQEVVRAAGRAVQEAGLEALEATERTSLPCAIGVRIVEATDDDLAKIEAATRPVVEAIADDPTAASYLDRIAELKAATVPAPFPAPCEGARPSDAELAVIPDGIYTATVTPRDSLRTGAPWGCDRTVESAVVTLVIEGSDWTQMGACGDDPAEVGSQGILEYVGDSLIMREPGFEGQVTYAWSADDTSLNLKLLEVPEGAEWPVLRMLFEHEFTRAGSGSISAIPDGTYTATVTSQDALRTGWPWVCAADVESMDVTFVVDGGDWTEIQTCDGGSPAVGSEGTLEYAGDTLAMGEATYRWSADDTSLTLEVMETTGGDPLSVLQFLFEHTFTRTPD